MRKIAVLEDFFNAEHRRQINETAEKCGFVAEFFPRSAFPYGHEKDYEIFYGLPTVELLKKAENLKWFCCSFAGVDKYLPDEVYPNPDVILTNSSGAYGTTISEHMIMVTLMLLRHMPTFTESVRKHEWHEAIPMRSICGSTITVLGAGDIGTNFARRAKAMGAKLIRGIRRTAKAGDPCYDEMYTFDRLDEILPKTEILVMALPSTPDTIGILSRERIALLPKDAIVVNVGRGTAIDQDALMDALNEERIAGAAIDVMVPEPLPADHPLWNTKNLLITPHISGNMSLGITQDLDVAMFCEDLENYAAGRPLKRYVNRKIGY